MEGGNLRDIVSLQAKASPYFQSSEGKFECIEHIDKGKTHFKTPWNQKIWEKRLPISDI